MLSPGTAAKELENDLLPKKNLPLAVKSGVRIAYGTDLGQGDHAMEFGLLIANGMSPLQALYAATRNSAELLGESSRLGSVQAGQTRRPGRKPRAIRSSIPRRFAHVSFVMKNGVVYRSGGREIQPPAP